MRAAIFGMLVLSLLAATKYGDRIRCVFEGFGMSDLVTFLESTDESRKADRNVEYGDPSDPATRKFLTSISPLTHVSRLKVPVFIAQGARDTRVPLNQSESLVAALRRSGMWSIPTRVTCSSRRPPTTTTCTRGSCSCRNFCWTESRAHVRTCSRATCTIAPAPHPFPALLSARSNRRRPSGSSLHQAPRAVSRAR